MCKCFICDATLNKIEFNSDHGDIDPCGNCLMVISEVFGDEADDDSEVILGDATEEELMKLEEDLYGFTDYIPLEHFPSPTSHLVKDLK